MTVRTHLSIFFRDAFLRGFCSRLVLLAILLFTLALLCGLVGGAAGVPLLVWHPDPGKQFLVGAVAAWLVVNVLLAGYLIDTVRPRLWRSLLPSDASKAFAIYVGGILLSLAFTGAILGVTWIAFSHVANALNHPPIPNREADTPADYLSFPWWLAAGGVGGLIAVALVVFGLPALAYTRRQLYRLGVWTLTRTKRINDWLLGSDLMEQAGRIRNDAPPEVHLHGLAAALFAGALIVFAILAFDVLGLWASPIVAFLLVLALGTGVYGFLAYHFPGTLALTVLAFGLFAVIGGLPQDKLRIPGLDSLYDARVPLEGSRDAKLLMGDEIDPRGFRPLAVVCVSGGGIRAAAWTSAVLRELEESFAARGLDFPYHVRVITGASGGMVGAAHFVATLHPPDVANRVEPYVRTGATHGIKHYHSRPGPTGRTLVRPDELCNEVMADSLAPILHQMIYGDAPAFFRFWPMRSDRGRALESSWSQNLNGSLDLPFQALREGEKAGWRPSLIFAPMLVEDGRRLLISNLDLGSVAVTAGQTIPDASSSQLFSRTSVELFRLFGNLPDFHLSTAARLSASFPFVSPAVGLPTVPRRRVVDAGYFDSYGVSLASAWLFANRDWIRANCTGVVLIQIRDGASERFRELKVPEIGPAPPPLLRNLEGITSPLEGVLAARTAAATFRNDEQLELLSRFFRKEGTGRSASSDYFTTVTFEYGGAAALSWHLTDNEKKDILEKAARLAPGAAVRMSTRVSERSAKAEVNQGEMDQLTASQSAKIARLIEWWEAKAVR